MSRQSYHRGECRVCGGDTAGNGFARASHERSKRHIAALQAEGDRIRARRRKYRKIDADRAALRAREA